MDDAGLAADAYVYGYPLVASLTEVSRFTREGMGPVPATPFNAFGHAHRLAGPDDAFVSVNNDTVYSIAQVDVGGGPVRLSVPDTDGAYYVLQFVDAWTNNIAYVGRRATGTDAGTFLIAPRGFTGEVPDDATAHPGLDQGGRHRRPAGLRPGPPTCPGSSGCRRGCGCTRPPRRPSPAGLRSPRPAYPRI